MFILHNFGGLHTWLHAENTSVEVGIPFDTFGVWYKDFSYSSFIYIQYISHLYSIHIPFTKN